jgi:hypothetical protein
VAGLIAGFEAATAELAVDSEDALEAAEQEGVRRLRPRRGPMDAGCEPGGARVGDDRARH